MFVSITPSVDGEVSSVAYGKEVPLMFIGVVKKMTNYLPSGGYSSNYRFLTMKPSPDARHDPETKKISAAACM